MSGSDTHGRRYPPRPLVRLGARLTVKSLLGSPLPLTLKRAALDASSAVIRAPRGTRRSEITLGGVRCETLGPVAGSPVVEDPGAGVGDEAAGATGDEASASPGRMLYLHGGAYVVGSPRAYRGLVGGLCLASGLEAHVPDYRLAPEHPFPAALDDALAAYRALLEVAGGPQALLVAGDSAGGGLALAMLAQAAREGLAMPAGCLLISPWLDLTLSGESIEEVGRRDALLSVRALEHGRRAYAAGTPLDDPGVSPLFGELGHLPPTLVQVGTDEVLLSDSLRLAERARAAGLELELSTYEGAWHDFQIHARMLADADRALAEAGDFARRVTRAERDGEA